MMGDVRWKKSEISILDLEEKGGNFPWNLIYLEKLPACYTRKTTGMRKSINQSGKFTEEKVIKIKYTSVYIFFW